MKEYNLSNPSVEEEERIYEMRKREKEEYYRAMEEEYYEEQARIEGEFGNRVMYEKDCEENDIRLYKFFEIWKKTIC